MDTIFDPSMWAHPGHTQAQGLMALALLLAAGSVGLASAVASRLRLIPLRR